MIHKEQPFNTRIFLQEKEEVLRSSTRHIPFGEKWSKTFPEDGGVYVIWSKDTPFYVGETSGLNSRMTRDLMRPINHAFTKKICTSTGITDLVSLRSHISATYKVSYVAVDLGRAEIEEYLILKWRDTLINKPTKRLLEGTQYSWVNQ